MAEEKNQQLIKFIVILIAVIFFTMLTVALVQTFVIKNMEDKLNLLQDNNQSVIEQNEEVENEIEIRNSEDFIDEFLEKEGYGKDGEVILQNS